MKAKMGRQYVLQRSVKALRAIASPPVESAQARIMLQRVVEKRSGDRPPSVAVSGVTGGYHRIFTPVSKLKRSLAPITFSGNPGAKFSKICGNSMSGCQPAAPPALVWMHIQYLPG